MSLWFAFTTTTTTFTGGGGGGGGGGQIHCFKKQSTNYNTVIFQA